MSLLNDIVKGLKRADPSTLGKLAVKVEIDPDAVLRSLPIVKKGMISRDRRSETLSYFILSQLAGSDLNEEVRDLLDIAYEHVADMDVPNSSNAAEVKCSECGSSVERDPPVFPSRITCPGCGTGRWVTLPEGDPSSLAVSDLHWSLSFIFEMARRGHIGGSDGLVEKLELLKRFDSAEIRKMSRAVLIMISEGK